jgi:hypothetical protein
MIFVWYMDDLPRVQRDLLSGIAGLDEPPGLALNPHTGLDRDM